MEEETTPFNEESSEKSDPAAGLYVFYDEANNVQVGVSGDYSIGEAIFMLGAARSKLELIQFQVLRQQQTQPQEKSRLILPT